MEKIRNTLKSAMDPDKATFSGLMDIIIIKKKDGTFRSNPFHVRFGSINFLKINDTLCVKINGEQKDIPIFIDKSGKVYFKKMKQVIKRSVYTSDSEISQSEIEDKSACSESAQTKSQEKSKRMKIYNWQWQSSVNKLSQQCLDKQTEQQKSQVKQTIWGLKNFITNFFRTNNKTTTKNIDQIFNNIKIPLSQDSIPQQLYQGEQSNLDPTLLLSLCGHLVKPTMKPKQIERIFFKHRVLFKQFNQEPLAILNNPNLVVMIKDTIYSWQIGMSIIVSELAFGKLDKSMIEKILQGKKSWLGWKKVGFRFEILEKNQMEKQKDQNQIKENKSSFLPLKRKLSVIEDLKSRVRFKKSRTPDNQTIKKFDLRQGQNQITFIISDTNNQYVLSLSASIFLWHESCKIVVTDIDGTITKSDFLGQVFPMVKIDWLHQGIVKLLNGIRNNGYKIIYLTARAIGQSFQTKHFLTEICRQGQLRLPEGPMITSYEGMYASFKREIIEKKPQVMKIELLTTLMNLFRQCPFFAGFGNRSTDAIAYRSVGIRTERIYIITEQSLIYRFNDEKFKCTYTQLNEHLEHNFPIVQARGEFTSSRYWRLQPQIPLKLLLKQLK